MTRSKKRSASANINKASEPPRKRKRTWTRASQPSCNQPTPGAEQNEKEDATQAECHVNIARPIALLQQSATPEAEKDSEAKPEPGPEDKPAKSSIVLHHKVHVPWQHLPFDKPQEIHLKIAINAHETDSDIVCYTPQSATQSHIAPWKNDMNAFLRIPHKAVMVTRNEGDGLKTHLMLFGQDMEDALEHKERYQHLTVIKQQMSQYWFPQVKRLLGERSEKVLSIKNPFDKSQHEFKVAEPIDLEVCRLRNLLETIKEHFRRNSGLLIPEVQDIFLRAEINVISYSATDAELAFEHELHSKWIVQMGVSLENVRRVSRAEACAFYYGCNLLQAQLRMVSQWGSPSDCNTATYNRMATVVLDVDGCFAGASTVTSIANNGHCAVKAINKAANTRNGLVKLRELIKPMLEREHGWTIRAAAVESDKTYEEVLEHLVADFEIALDVYEGEKTMAVFFPEGVTATNNHGDKIIAIKGLVLSRGSVEAVVQNWLEPIIALAKQQLRALNGTPPAPQDHEVKRQVLMTGYWSQPKCIELLFRAALPSHIIEDYSFIPVKTMDNSDFATLGALWSMTANGNRRWEEEVTR